MFSELAVVCVIRGGGEVRLARQSHPMKGPGGTPFPRVFCSLFSNSHSPQEPAVPPSAAATLRDLLRRPGLLQAPGCFDAFSARLIEQAGFQAAYMTGFGSSASVLGLPDTGQMSFAEMATHAGNIAGALRIPLIADADTGYGNAINTHRTVRAYARAGVAAVQIEDQVAPKKCGHTRGKAIVPLGEMLGKVRAAVDARAEQDIVIVVRTDARAVAGFEEALERCLAFEAAGADVIFFEAPESEEEMAAVARRVKAPLLINLVEGGKTPLLPRRKLEALGYKIAIYPVSALLAAAKAMQRQLARLRAEDDYGPGAEQITFDELKTLVGFPAYYEMEERYKG
jgi:carboxyvinyl-carboxyphosphonate phosphorylmutase